MVLKKQLQRNQSLIHYQVFLLFWSHACNPVRPVLFEYGGLSWPYANAPNLIFVVVVQIQSNEQEVT